MNDTALRDALAEAIQDIEEWAAYASPYFQQKHDLAGTVAKYRAALATPPAAPRASEPIPIGWVLRLHTASKYLEPGHIDWESATTTPSGPINSKFWEWAPLYTTPPLTMDETRQAIAALAGASKTARKLARHALWIAYVWNDHNFEAAHIEARRTAKNCGINSFDEANAWLGMNHDAAIATPPAAVPAGTGIEKLAAFGAAILRDRGPDCRISDLDSGTAQDYAVECGVIEKRQVAGPCGESCFCEESDDFPTMCFFIPDDVRAAMSAHQTVDTP